MPGALLEQQHLVGGLLFSQVELTEPLGCLAFQIGPFVASPELGAGQAAVARCQQLELRSFLEGYQVLPFFLLAAELVNQKKLNDVTMKATRKRGNEASDVVVKLEVDLGLLQLEATPPMKMNLHWRS